MLSEDIFKILLAIGIGGAIGLEREYRDKAAGFRTLIFICVGATLFAMLSSKLAGDRDPTRIAANIVSGVGFLGAGVILRDGGRVVGLTTAATIWLVAARRWVMESASASSVVTVVSQSMQPSVMDWP